MSTDGGGWTLVMKAIDTNFAYDDAPWTDEILVEEAGRSVEGRTEPRGRTGAVRGR